jgi:hypothetical protein
MPEFEDAGWISNGKSVKKIIFKPRDKGPTLAESIASRKLAVRNDDGLQSPRGYPVKGQQVKQQELPLFLNNLPPNPDTPRKYRGGDNKTDGSNEVVLGGLPSLAKK